MVGWMDGYVGGGARHRRALICPLLLISLLVLIWIATCGREWIHSYKQSTTGCSTEWQPPYVPVLLCRGYNNKPPWQIKTTGIKVHDIITCSSWKLPSPLPAFSFSLFILCRLHSHSVLLQKADIFIMPTCWQYFCFLYTSPSLLYLFFSLCDRCQPLLVFPPEMPLTEHTAPSLL